MSRANLSRIIYGLSEPVLLVQPDGTLIAANSSASRLFRRPSPELVGANLSALVIDNPEKLIRYLRQCSQNSEWIPGGLNILAPGEQPIVCKAMGGFVRGAEQPSLLWLRLLPRESAINRLAANPKGVQALAEERVRQLNEQRWRTAFENSAIGITMADFAGRFFAANSAFLKMLGYTASELYQLTFLDVTHKQDREANRELVRELTEGKRRHFEIEKRYCRKDGTLVWACANVALVPGMGAIEPFWFGVVEDITQRKRLEEELRLQIEVLQNIPAVAWTVTPDGRCDFINQFFLDATGMSQEHIQSHPSEWNKTGNDLPPLFSCLPPPEHERGARFFWNGIRTGEGWSFETQHRHASDGTYHWYLDRAVPLRDSQGKIVRFIGTCTDIESLKRAQAELQDRETRLQAFLGNSPNLIFLKDRQGRYLYVNQELKRVFGITEEQIIGKRDDEVFSAEQAGAFQANDRQVLDRGVRMEFEEVAVQEDGQHTSIVQKFPLRNAEGEIYAIGGVVTDITERKEAQHALEIAQAELARVSRLTTMGELAASIAHEVNQPLTAVTSNASACLRLLADRNLDPAVLRRALEEIVTYSTRASAVLARIRAFIKKAPAERNELDLNELIQEVLALIAREVHENRVLIERRLTRPLPLVMGDRIQLQQVLLNLIINGIEAMTAVSDWPRLLCVQSRVGESGNVLVAVCDSGTGLGSEADRVFTPFFTTKTDGMGMGLPISRSLVEGHGGRLWATPNSPHGTVFYVALPVATRSRS
jgi:PAS domain S-box-containing protein